jgi:hypothetical protein
MGEVRNQYKILELKPEGKKPPEVLRKDSRIILKWT